MNNLVSFEQQSLIHDTLEMLSTFSTEAVPRVSESDWDYLESGSDWYKVCSQGSIQSPISIDSSNTIKITSIGGPYYPFTFNYPGISLPGSFVDKTFSIQYPEGQADLCTLNGTTRKFQTTRVEFHAPAEHIVKGKQKALELHILHKEQVTGNLFILAMLFKLSTKHNQSIQDVIDGDQVEIGKIIGDRPDLYSYFGSSTYPPCAETVLWAICTETQSISFEQVKFFSSKWENNQAFARGHGNNRSVQPLNHRLVFNFS